MKKMAKMKSCEEMMIIISKWKNECDNEMWK